VPDNTERPITITHGTNRLIGSAVDAIAPALDTVLDTPPPQLAPLPFWDGSAAARIVGILERTFVAGIENLPAPSAQAV